MGEFSFDNMNVRDGIKGAAAADISLTVVPYVLFFVIKETSAASLTSHDLQVLTLFAQCAILLGTAVTVSIYLYGCYPKGSKSRLLFGMSSGALIIAYSLIALVMSGLTPVLSGIGVPLDMKYVALIVAYASAPLMFSAVAEFVASRGRWLETLGSAEERTVGAE